MYKKRDSSAKSSFFSVKQLLLRDKSAQVTIFIILGLLLILTMAIILTFQREIVTFGDKEVQPTEQSGVENFVTSCIKLITDEALFLIGSQGGYINVPAGIANDVSLHLRTSPFTVIPYWAYGENTNIPSLNDIKNRIDVHLEDNLPSCVLGTGAFQQAYDLVERSEVRADTNFLDRKILFHVDWDIEVRDKTGIVISNLKNFAVESPIKFKLLHDLASKIVESEMRDLKLEDITQDLLALEHPQVPLAGTEFTCSDKTWPVSKVRETVKDMLRVNLRELKIAGTEFVEFPEELPYYQNHYVWELDNDFRVRDASVQFTFENNYPFSLDVRPRSGEILKSSQLGGSNPLVSALCLQTWKFVYDISFPVVVETIDETTGYRLKYGLTVHLKRNYPDRSDQAYEAPNIILDTFSDSEFCADARIPMTVRTFEIVENKQTGVFSREPLDEVEIKYVCLRYSCDIGRTIKGFDGQGATAAYKTNFPYCAGAVIRGSKEGYKENYVQTVSRNNAEIELSLTPLFNFPAKNIKVVKHELTRSGTLGPAEELKQDETVLIQLKFQENSSLPPLHEIDFVISPSFDTKFSEENKIPFLGKADFTYNLNINLLSGEAITGGYKGTWTVPINQLESAQEIVLHVINTKSTGLDQQLDLFAGLDAYSRLAPKPELR
ncbi:MAG TPA: hypothetical protein VJI98_05600 [Candidatus Nanoarchaeia archaeon]|nr:hypothetical protein [Candidatus Nanoarchaeia archaeon]